MARYRHDLRRDYKRLEAFDTSISETPFGRGEYAQAGERTAGARCARRIRRLRLRRRPGPGQPPPWLPVVAFSAGSSSALQLVLRHPDRVSRLVLISPNCPHPQPLPKPPRRLAMRLLARQRLEGMFGTPPGFVPDDRERAALRELIDSLFPVGPRAAATIYDSYIGNLDIATYAFESITVLSMNGALDRSTTTGPPG